MLRYPKLMKKEFKTEFKFIYEEAYPKLKLTAEEAQIYITSHAT